MDTACHWLSCVLTLVVAQLVGFREHKEPLPSDLALLYQPACVCGGGGGGCVCGCVGVGEGVNSVEVTYLHFLEMEPTQTRLLLCWNAVLLVLHR